MIDSINFIIRNINPKDFSETMNSLVKRKPFYNLKERNIYLRDGEHFNYKNLNFKYYFHLNILIIETHPYKILNKKTITLRDKQEYVTKLESILSELINNIEEYKLEIHRIDYYVDLKLYGKKDKYVLLLNKYNKDIFQYMKKSNEYTSSSYLKTKQGKRNINIYSRYDKTKNIEDIGILRLEVQNMKRMINGEFKKYGISKDLDNYWTTYAMEDYFFKVIEGYCYSGIHYKRKIANKIIAKSDYKNSMKTKLKQFLLDVETLGLHAMSKSKEYNTCKINNRIKYLEEIGINPIPLPKDFEYDKLDNLSTIARDVANEKYFK